MIDGRWTILAGSNIVHRSSVPIPEVAGGASTMAKAETRSLFGDPEPDPEPRPDSDLEAPLAERMRPRTLDGVRRPGSPGRQGRLIRRLVEDGGPPALVDPLGAPGTGKTTLARLLAGGPAPGSFRLSAVLSGVKELREAIAEAREATPSGRTTVLFVDEIHRFNKGQQDALLPAVEDGTVTLIGATTENPSFEVNAALLSRARVLDAPAADRGGRRRDPAPGDG